jgi:hypothetical protein
VCRLSTTESRQVTLATKEETELKSMIWVERECSWRHPDVLEANKKINRL